MKTLLRGAVAGISFGFCFVALAQDAAAPPVGQDPAPFVDAPVVDAPVADAPDAPATPAGPVEAFEAAMQEWLGLEQELEAARKNIGATTGPARDAAIEGYKAVVGRQNESLPKVIAAADAALTADPENAMAKRILIGAVAFHVRSDENLAGLEGAEKLLGRGLELPVLYDLAGTAAYASDQFDLAGEYFGKIGPADGISFGRQAREDLATAKNLYAEELAIREREAAADDLPRVKIATAKGDIVIELFENQAPNTVANFVSLVEKGFYDGTTFHRVLPNFMAQGGDPKGTGSGGPGYTIPCECYREDAREHFEGTLSMAHAGRDTGGSQFFLTFRRTPHLDGKHTAFGRVIEGMDVLAKIQRRDPSSDRPQPEPEKIVDMEVLRKRDHAYEPTKTPE